MSGQRVTEQGLKVTTQHIVCEAETVNRAVQSSQGVGSNSFLTVGQRKGFLPIGVIYGYFKINPLLIP
jgi:hypothetical protein